MKKYLLIIAAALCTPLTSAATQWPLALSAPILIPLLTGNAELTEAINDGLNFDHAREIAFSVQLPKRKKNISKNGYEETAPVELTYQLRWGYKGAGNKNQPFEGIRGTVNVQFNYDGLSFQLCKSRSLRRTIRHFIAPAVTVTPCQEFYFKLAQLAWTVSQQKVADLITIREALETLIARLKLTQGGDQCSLYSIPVLSTPERVGLETYLTQAPDQCAAQFVILSQKGGALASLITNTTDAQRTEYLNALLAQIDYYQAKPTTIQLPHGGSVYIPFWYAGSGDPEEPFAPMAITLNIPATQQVPQATEWTLALDGEQACFVRAIMLILHHRRQPLPRHQFTEELGTLCARMAITPSSDGKQPGRLRSLIGLICHYHQSIIRYSFEKPVDHILDNEELMMQLVRVAYHAYVMEANDAQDVADFVTLHTADALRCYQGTLALRSSCNERAELPLLKGKGVKIKWDLFIKTVLGKAPGEEA